MPERKRILVTLTKIEYRGDNIGSEFQFDVNIFQTLPLVGIDDGRGNISSSPVRTYSFSQELEHGTISNPKVLLYDDFPAAPHNERYRMDLKVSEIDKIKDTGKGSVNFDASVNSPPRREITKTINVVAEGGDKGKTGVLKLTFVVTCKDMPPPRPPVRGAAKQTAQKATGKASKKAARKAAARK